MDMTNETLIVLCWELYEQGVPKIRIAQRLGKHCETIHLWIKGIKGVGLLGFLDKYRQAKKGERVYNTVRPHQALGYVTPLKFLEQRKEYSGREVMCH